MLTDAQHSRAAAADRSGRGRQCRRAGDARAAPPTPNRTCDAARVRADARRAVLPAARRPGLGPPSAAGPADGTAPRDAPRCLRACPRFDSRPSNSRPPTSSRSTAPSTRRWSRGRWSCSTPSPTPPCWTCSVDWAISRWPWPAGPAGWWAWKAMPGPGASGPRHNARRNGIDNAAFHVADLSQPPGDTAATALPHGPNVRYSHVLLDPPRAGAREMLPTVARLAPEARAVYFMSSGQSCQGYRHAGSRYGFRLRAAGSARHVPAYHSRRIARAARAGERPFRRPRMSLGTPDGRRRRHRARPPKTARSCGTRWSAV